VIPLETVCRFRRTGEFMVGTLERLSQNIARVAVVYPIGRVARLERGLIVVRGLAAHVALGTRVQIAGDGCGEVVAIDEQHLTVLPEEVSQTVRVGQEVRIVAASELCPDATWIGRVIDPFGQPLDGRPLPSGMRPRPVLAPPPPAAQRRPLGPRCATGLAALDTVLPVVRGQRVGLFAGSGVGKSTLMARLATALTADVVVVGLVGERGREVGQFVTRALGEAGMARTVVIAATSDQSPLVRRRCAWTAMAVAEHFRDEGKHVLLLIDSITRLAEAHRDIALALGEPMATGGFPPSTGAVMTGLVERAGPGTADVGDITAILTVLVAGSDLEGYVADTLRGVLDGHVVLDRRIAERGRFPAIDLLRSVSRSLPEAASDGENALIRRARAVFSTWERIELMVQAGLYQPGTDPAADEAIRLWPQLDGFLAETTPTGSCDAAFARLAAIVDGPP
jgi:flagellum-specific ATP synthase